MKCLEVAQYTDELPLSERQSFSAISVAVEEFVVNESVEGRL